MSLKSDAPSASADKHEAYDLTHITTLQSEKTGYVEELEEEEHGHYHRSFSSHQMHIISLGSNIGSGLFIGSGSALAVAGPGGCLVAYTMVCSCVWAVLQTLAEMTIAFPVSGNYIDYADRWVDPAVAFGAGFAEWLGWTAIVGSEAAFFHILLGLWAGDSFPLAASLTIFLFACLLIFTMPNTVFAWFEYFTSLIKLVIFLILIIVSTSLVCGAGPLGHVHDGATWRDYPVFKNGFPGFSLACLLAVWAVGDQIFIGVIGGEVKNPRFSMAHATKLVPYRVGFVYVASIMLIGLLVPSDDNRLLGGSGVTASPFVIAIKSAGIKYLPDITNACIMCGVLAIAAESVYLSSRVLRTMSYQKLIPLWFAKIDEQGRPRRALYVTCGAGVVFAYINLSGGGKVALNWLIQITAASYFINWILVAITSWRFHKCLEAQQDPLFKQVYAWKSSFWPLAPGWLFTVCMVLLVCCFTVAIAPRESSDHSFTVENFFEYTLGCWLISGLTIAYKLILKTKFRDPATADLKTGRNILTLQDLQELDAYYALPKWRRFCTYIKLW